MKGNKVFYKGAGATRTWKMAATHSQQITLQTAQQLSGNQHCSGKQEWVGGGRVKNPTLGRWEGQAKTYLQAGSQQYRWKRAGRTGFTLPLSLPSKTPTDFTTWVKPQPYDGSWNWQHTAFRPFSHTVCYQRGPMCISTVFINRRHHI